MLLLWGILAADLSLNADDYRSGERTFQLLTQAVGRAGRGKKEGHALIQTYSPDHYSIQTAAKQDYEEFYQEEMGYRLLMDYPPAAHMMAVLGSSEDEKLLGDSHALSWPVYRKNICGKRSSCDRSCVCICRER